MEKLYEFKHLNGIFRNLRGMKAKIAMNWKQISKRSEGQTSWCTFKERSEGNDM